jgi:Ras-related protein Rab-32
MAQAVNKEYLFKVLVVGEVATGKTSMIRQYVHNTFSNQYKTTIGVDFALKVVNIDDDTSVKLQLWDIAGQERFGNMTRVYYKEALGAVIVFDVTRASTFEAVQKWKADIDSKVEVNGKPIPVVLLANKCDLAKEGPVKDSAAMDKYCEEKGFIGWYETSAKENKNIKEACEYLARKMIENDKALSPDKKDVDDDGKRRLDLNQPAEKGGCCG